MSAICQNFVQNAWKKELCSNCFKSKDEHLPKAKPKTISATLNRAVGGIIKNTKKAKPKRNVNFNKNLIEVIGYGGEDWSEVEEDDDVEAYEESHEDESDSNGEDEKELIRLTKANTDYNTSSLNESAETKKSYAQLMLGKPQVDSEGRKQTLLVSVTPFGQDSSPAKKPKPVSHIPIAKNKDIAVDNKTVILTSYAKSEDANKHEKSLLDEITETLENSKNPIQIITRKKIQKEIILSVPKPVSMSNKENINEDNLNDKDSKVVKSNIPERKNGLSRNPVIKREDKPIIFQTAVAKIELMNNKNTKFITNIENNNNNIQQKDILNKEHNRKPSDEIAHIENKKLDVNHIEININKVETESSTTDDTTSNSSLEESTKDDSDSSLDKIKTSLSNIKYQNMSFPESRELAGEPDGRADPDESSEPPALPLTPPPNLDANTAVTLNEKPKVPSKPSTILIRKPAMITQHNETQNILTTFVVDTKLDDNKIKLVKQDSNGSDVCKISNKRRAPKPPMDEPASIYTRNSIIAAHSDSPVVREKEKRERASSCSPKIRNFISNNPHGDVSIETLSNIPEPAPRKSLSISTDSLASCDEKKKEKSRGRFSLKKFLRMGSNKDLPKLPMEISKIEDDLQPLPKPRLVIVHPLDLNSGKVEVVNKNIDQFTIHGDYAHRASKPPPPPRNYDESKPNLPHPPKSAELLNRHKFQMQRSANSKKIDTVYANIGEVRSAITPNKPQRTASMREREAQQQQQSKSMINHNYEPVNIKNSTENVYDYISGRSSSPEYDSCKNSPKTENLQQRSESSVDVSADYFKYNNIPRSMSLTYCGSETESEIYSPYSYYGSESEVAEDDHDWNNSTGRTHKLRSRKGRSIVHKNLEDNYGAVVVANHEALAQVLENIQQSAPVLPALRGLKSTANLRWSDFSLKNTVAPLVVGSRAFHQAMWGSQHVTLVIGSGSAANSPISLGTFSLVPITEFSDLIPVKYLPMNVTPDIKHLQATVAVLPCMQVNTIQTYSDMLKTKTIQTNEDVWKEVSFVLLQLVNALKTLQAQGIEELPLSLTSFVLCREMDKESHYRLCVLQGLGEDMSSKNEEDKVGTLCMCVLTTLNQLLPNAKLSPLIKSLLNTERAVSLTQVKSVLEFSLWGPSDVALGTTVRERELALQRWLDLQRATVLHGLVCTKVNLTIYEECHLLFLVRSNARMMCDASILIESSYKHKFAH